MNQEQVKTIIERLASVWPRQRSAETDREWMNVLRTLDYTLAGRAVDALRDTLGFPPTIADLRSAYRAVEVIPPPSVQEYDETVFDLYGSKMDDWCYCYQCDMAITLEERSTEPHFRPGHGLHHKVCPRQGAAPTIPAYLRLEREEAMRKRGRA